MRAAASYVRQVIPRLDALEDTTNGSVFARVRNLEISRQGADAYLQQLVIPRIDGLELTVQTLPKRTHLAISRLGGRISNLDERMHSLAGTFTDHEELTQVRQEQLRTELLIRLDPPVL